MAYYLEQPSWNKQRYIYSKFINKNKKMQDSVDYYIFFTREIDTKLKYRLHSRFCGR